MQNEKPKNYCSCGKLKGKLFSFQNDDGKKLPCLVNEVIMSK